MQLLQFIVLAITKLLNFEIFQYKTDLNGNTIKTLEIFIPSTRALQTVGTVGVAFDTTFEICG